MGEWITHYYVCAAGSPQGEEHSSSSADWKCSLQRGFSQHWFFLPFWLVALTEEKILVGGLRTAKWQAVSSNIRDSCSFYAVCVHHRFTKPKKIASVKKSLCKSLQSKEGTPAKFWIEMLGRLVVGNRSRGITTLGINLEDMNECHHEITNDQVTFSTQ